MSRESGRSAKARRAAQLSAEQAERPGGRTHQRITRTIILGAIAVAAAIAWLAREFEIDTRELFGYLELAVLFVGAPILLAFAVAIPVWLIRRRRR